MTPEGKIVKHLCDRVKALGGITRKCEWSNRVGAPDQLVMLSGRHYWVECKAPGKTPTKMQLREHSRMSLIGGCAVYVASSIDEVDAIIAKELRLAGVKA